MFLTFMKLDNAVVNYSRELARLIVQKMIPSTNSYVHDSLKTQWPTFSVLVWQGSFHCFYSFFVFDFGLSFLIEPMFRGSG